MSDHPLRTYVRDAATTLAEIAAKAGTTRQTLHRIMRGDNATLDVLRRISVATGGVVTVGMLADPPALDGADDAGLPGHGHEISAPFATHEAAE